MEGAPLPLLCNSFFSKILSNQSFTKELYYKLIWRKNFCIAVNLLFPTLCSGNGNYANLQSHIIWQKFRESKDFWILRRCRNYKNFVKVTFTIEELLDKYPKWFYEIFCESNYNWISHTKADFTEFFQLTISCYELNLLWLSNKFWSYCPYLLKSS